MNHDELNDRRVVALAKRHKCSAGEIRSALDQHPLEVDRDAFLRRTVALELVRLDQLEETFAEKAMAGDVASGSLLVKIAERRATLLGLNAPIGHAVSIIQHEPPEALNSTEKTRKVLWELMHPGQPFKLEYLYPDDDPEQKH